MSTPLSQQFRLLAHSCHEAFDHLFDRLMENVSSDTEHFNHVAAFPDCPMMWSLDDTSRGAADASPQAQASSPQCCSQRQHSPLPISGEVQYHYHYYLLSGFASTLATISAVAATSLFLMLAWVGLMQIRTTLMPTSTLETANEEHMVSRSDKSRSDEF